MTNEDRLSDEENQYEQFRDLVKEGSGEEAWDVFKETPGLVNYLPASKFEKAYRIIRRCVGEKEAVYFAARFIKSPLEALDKATLPNLIADTGEATVLENSLIRMRSIHSSLVKELKLYRGNSINFPQEE